MNLTTKQKAHLRGLGQSLRPQLHVGHEGATPGVLSALEDLFRGRELVKGRVLKSAEHPARELAEVIARESGAAVAGVVGFTFLLYRPNPDLKERIELPDTSAATRSARREPPRQSPPTRRE